MKDFQHNPLPRHEALAPLSRDHYAGLVQSQHLIKAAEQDDVTRRIAIAEFVDAWDREIEPHLRDEERLLAGLLSDADRARLLAEHRQLEEDAATLRSLRKSVDPSAVTLREIGERLHRHVRWEERELFSTIQQSLNGEQLAALERQTAGIDSARNRKFHQNPTDTDA